MIPRPKAGTQQRPPPPQRVASTGPHRPLNRPALPSKLSNVRTASASASAIQQENLASQQVQHQSLHPAPLQPTIKQETASVKPEIIDIDRDSNNNVPEASTVNTKAHSANNQLADGQSPRSWDAASLPPPTPLQQPAPAKTQPLPLPGRPAFLTEPARRSVNSVTGSTGGRRDASRRSTGLRAPDAATSLPRGKVADFFPWTGIPGAHPEDQLNEILVKNGNNDKGQGPNCPNIAAESNTARPNIWPSLKNKSGMHLLSALFCQVLDKRQQMGRCTAPSTFKPPPRVTLTDTKREAWLKDLANPDVSLRRLSRTIPHGIRGKALLDHCITKDIPIARAVWLSKCVGANEIRAFKRKGVSGPSAIAGEVKWIRDWTVCVEQFVEGVIGECGQLGWSKKMNYCIRLATYFFAEHLLDGEHYIDWLLTSLETSTTERLPIWVLLSQVYWKNLISQRKRGRRLAEAFLAHVERLMRIGSPSNRPVVDRIQQLISVLSVAHQGCLVMPKTWKQHEDTFEVIASLDNHVNSKDAMRNVHKRNFRMLGGLSSTATSQKHTKQMLVDALDQVRLDGQIPHIALPRDGAMHTATSTLAVVLEWATSRHRQGMARVHLTARILRQWNITGVDTDDTILQALEATAMNDTMDSEPLHKIVALLVRSSHFSVGKYLQWLISIGALSAIPTASNDAQLLLELPIEDLQPHVLNLRRTILSRMGFSALAESKEFERQKALISALLQTASSSSGSLYTLPTDTLKSLSSSKPTGAVRSMTARWLCDVLTTVRDIGMVSYSDARVFKGGLKAFSIARQTFERFEDYLSLSNCIRAATSSTGHARFLATIADTISMHADIFAAMGVLDELTHCLCRQQQGLRTRLPHDKTFLMALSSLVQRVPCEEFLKTAIIADLQYCEMQSSAAACSPASDSMTMNAAGIPETDEDVDRVLASGNTMDEQLFVRMFGIISDRATKTGLRGIVQTGGWFAQLHQFDPLSFEQRLQGLVVRLKEPVFAIQTFVDVAATLVGSGCMRIELPFRTLERSLNPTKDPVASGRFATMCLELVMPLKTDGVLPDTPELYKFRLEQKLFRENHVEDVLRICFLALSTGSSAGIDYSSDDRVLSFLRRHISKSGKNLIAESVIRTEATFNSKLIQRLLDHLVNPGAASGVENMTAMTRMQRILASANETSLQSCKLALRYCFSSTSLDADDKRDLAQVFQESIEQDSPVWHELVTTLDKSLIYEIHAWARDRAITLMSDFVSSADSAVKVDEIRRYLTAADIASSPAEAQAGQPQTFSLLNEHLASLGKLVDTVSPLDVAYASQRQRIGFGLDMLLQLTARHFQTSADVLVSSPEVVTLMTTLCLLLVHQKLQNHRAILEYILDVTSMIVDDLSTDFMAAIVRNLPAFARNDPRIRYLFGITFSPDSWLALASKVYAQQAIPQQPQSSIPSSLPRPSHPLPPRPGGALAQRTQLLPGNQNSGTQAPTQQQQPQPPPVVLPQRQQTGPQPTPSSGPAQSRNFEIKYNPFQIRRWEIMPDPTPNMGSNDTSLSLGLFQARKVS